MPGATIDEPASVEMKPLFSFGVVSDIQHMDKDPRPAGLGVNPQARYYRDALDGLRHAVNYWCKESPHEVTFLLQLGDIIDGHNRRLQQTDLALHRVLKQFQAFKGKVHHCWGNHELYNFKRRDLFLTPLYTRPGDDQKAGTRTGHYYSFCPHPKFRFIMLDTFERSTMGYEKTDEVYIESEAFIRARNPCESLLSPEKLEGLEKRFVCFNGAPSDTQLRWLEQTLREAKHAGQHVVVFGHGPVHPGSCASKYLCWNYEEILGILHRSGCVVAYLAGHCHAGGYVLDEQGTHHLTLHGMVEAQPGTADFITAHVYPDKLLLQGHGRLPSLTIELPSSG